MGGFTELAVICGESAPCDSAARDSSEGVPSIRRRRARPTSLEGARRQFAGFTYVGLLLLVALMGIALSVVGQVWQTVRTIEKEDELLYAGGEIRRAIRLYVANAPGGGVERYPRRLEDLLKDPRYSDVRRYLRRIYRDPITGSAEWGLVKAGDFITGVYSQSDKEPLKKGAFRPVDQSFEGKTKYSEWVFLPIIGRRPVGIPAGGSAAPGIPQPQPKPQPGTPPARPRN